MGSLIAQTELLRYMSRFPFVTFWPRSNCLILEYALHHYSNERTTAKDAVPQISKKATIDGFSIKSTLILFGSGLGNMQFIISLTTKFWPGAVSKTLLYLPPWTNCGSWISNPNWFCEIHIGYPGNWKICIPSQSEDVEFCWVRSVSLLPPHIHAKQFP